MIFSLKNIIFYLTALYNFIAAFSTTFGSTFYLDLSSLSIKYWASSEKCACFSVI